MRLVNFQEINFEQMIEGRGYDMSKIKTSYLLCVAFLVVTVLVCLQCLGQLAEPDREPRAATCDYFNGKVVEMAEDSLWVEPTEDWEWRKVSRVEFPKTNYIGKPLPTLPEVKNGDEIRVAYNGSSLEWRGDEAFIGTVFAVYMVE